MGWPLKKPLRASCAAGRSSNSWTIAVFFRVLPRSDRSSIMPLLPSATYRPSSLITSVQLQGSTHGTRIRRVSTPKHSPWSSGRRARSKPARRRLTIRSSRLPRSRSTYSVGGTGMTVAVIDTGVDYNNPALGGGFGPGQKVIAGYDFADGTSDPMAVYSQHGTSIAGLIGSSDPSDLGVAPGVDIVALRVTDSSNTASLQNVANALQWVINNHSQYDITAVNMSLADGGNYAQNWFANDGGAGQQVTQLIGQLTAMNIPVIAATGNSFTGAQGEGFAAIVAGTISVTATDLSGNLLSNAQRLGSAIGGASATTIAAPGSGLTAPSGDSGTVTADGTSFATALVSGGVSLLQEIYQSRFGTLPTVAQIKSWLQGGATPITDPVTGITLGEMNLLKSASLIPTPTPKPAPKPPVVSISTTTTSTTSTSNSATTSASTTTSTSTTSSVQVYVNGQAVSAASTSSSTSLDETVFAELIQAMTTAWQASPSAESLFEGTQVQIWNA